MWAVSPIYFSGHGDRPAVPLLRDRPAKNGDKTSASRRDKTSDNSGNSSLVELHQRLVEGPPSSQSIRRPTTEMRLTTSLRRGQSHKLASSTSSSVTSFSGDLDQALDNIDLVRCSSFNSMESSSAAKDATEGFQPFGKSLFHRRGKSKQESTSSGSSLYSAEGPTDTFTGLKDAVLPKLFTRRKPSRDESATVQKLQRVQISGPYNFQHVMHTNRDAAEDTLGLDDEQDELGNPRGRPRAATGASDHTYTNVLTETVAEHDEIPDLPQRRPGLINRHTGNFQTMRRLMKSGKLSDLSVSASASIPTNRQPPQRPPRSPVEPPSPPPPRVSSRQILHPVTIDTTTYPMERPMTSATFQRPQPFSPSSPIDQPPTPTRLSFTPPVDSSIFSREGLLSRPRTATPEPAWPLASPTIINFESPLPDLVEDDGNPQWSRCSYTSRGSTNASLRGSKSVPTLRKPAQNQPTESGEQTEAAMDSLRMPTKENPEQPLESAIELGRASWEDDIDYCYEHEAEANCDYQWERPSMDMDNDDGIYQVRRSFSTFDAALSQSNIKRSPGMLSGSSFEVPVLSPASQTSPVLGSEAVTPVTGQRHNALMQSPFDQKPLMSKTLKRGSRLILISNQRELQGGQFSPSLLVPQDYQPNSLATTPELPEATDVGPSVKYGHSDDSYIAQIALEPSGQRSSTATTESDFTSSTDSIAGRHMSTNSSWTALTRHTASTSSLNKLSMMWIDEAEPVPTLAAPAQIKEVCNEPEMSFPASEDIVPELLMAIPQPRSRRAMHKSHASESFLRSSVAAMDSQQSPNLRRSRARTSSLGQPPPVGQYALFPRSNIKSQGDKI
ncbi:hypothetical protein NQ176_g1130 [Zarea fungicola]|uniref:Uncharacterized protein n=1 Tax=Zarea fungicola TaxID=93591 RepID=A0ACC1NVC8_9HYPO|nr:hypothetical protein NQ176_g1130 [Lecanicillium fungicola]